MKKTTYILTSRLVFILLILSVALSVQAQKKGKPSTAKTENSLLWEVSGKNLKQPSYLFGTFHLLNSDYVDSLPLVGDKLKASQAVVGEVVMDSSALMKVMMTGMMADTTLEKLLSPEDYQLTDDYLKELSGFNLAMFSNFKPMLVQVTMMQLEWAKMNPDKGTQAKQTPMDIYFQNQGEAAGKTVVGLETMEEQFDALFNQFTLKRQAEMLMESVKERKESKSQLEQMEACYRSQDLACLTKMMYDSKTYKPEEIAGLLDNRNKKWMLQLPALMQAKSTFIAVGAGHLVGENGLVQLLRKQGYTVKPLQMAGSTKAGR